MAEKKYKLIKHRDVNLEFANLKFQNIFRLEALKDIPAFGVKAGDLGGWVTSRFVLSQKGDCWIGENAYVFGNARISDEAYVGGNAKVLSMGAGAKIHITQAVKIDGNAKVILSFQNKTLSQYDNKLSGTVHITDEAEVLHLFRATGNAKIYGNAKIEGAEEIADSAEVYGNAFIGMGSKILGRSRIFDNAVVNKSATVTDAVIGQDMEVGSYDVVSSFSIQNDAIASGQERQPALSVKSIPDAKPIAEVDLTTLDVFNEIKANIAAYETDIVKIIKHPVMTDRADPHTLQMIMALNKATRLSRKPASPEFEEAVIALEEKFLTAESNALKIASTLLTEEERRKTEKAKDLLAIAANEGSSENEKKVSLKQAFKQLEGVIAVPDIAVDTFRAKIGLKELES